MCAFSNEASRMNEETSLLYAKLLGETAQITWAELHDGQGNLITDKQVLV